MGSEPLSPTWHELPARRPGEAVAVAWLADLRTFACRITADGVTTTYGTTPRQFVRPEQLFRAIRWQWAENEPDEQMVRVLLCMDRAAGPQEFAPLPWETERRGR